MTGKFFRPTPSELVRVKDDGNQDEHESEIRDRRSDVNGPLISLAGHRIPLDSLDHIAVIGQSGSGKNLIMGPTFKTCVEAVVADPTRRMIVIEVKGEYIQALKGMGVKYELITFTYQEGKTCDLAKDFSSHQLISQLSYSLIPKLEGNNAYFRHGARALNIAITATLHELTKGDWGIDDLVNMAFSDVTTMRTILSRTDIGERVLNTFMDEEGDDETLYKLRAELGSRLWPLLVPAAKYQISDALSIIDFWKGKTESPILVLKLNPERLDTEQVIAAALLQRSFEFIMGLTPHFDPTKRRKDRLLWLDDFGFYRKIPKVLESMELIRGCGGLLIAAFQSIEGLRSRESYGDEADGLLANFANYVLLSSSGSPTTAKWCASLFGQHEVVTQAWGTSYGKEGSQGRADERHSIQNRVLDSAFLHMKRPSPANGITCYLKTQEFGEEKAKVLPWNQVIKRHPPRAQVTFTPLPPEWESPAVWTKERIDFLRYGKTSASPRTRQESRPFDSFLSEFDEEIRRIVFDIAWDALERLIQSDRDLGL